jgi:hypothetical protein
VLLAATSVSLCHVAGPFGHFWYQKLDKVVSSCLQPSTAAFVAAKVQQHCTPPLALVLHAKGTKISSVQVAADTFIYTPMNVGLFFALMTVVEGGRWTVSLSAHAGLLYKGYMHKVTCNALTSVQICLSQFNNPVAVRLCIACACVVEQSAPSSLSAMRSQDSPDKVLDY